MGNGQCAMGAREEMNGIAFAQWIGIEYLYGNEMERVASFSFNSVKSL